MVVRWHPAGESTELAGAKTLSYAPNLAASRRAAASGFDDALLLSADGVMLEGPTFSIGWVVDGVLETPALDLHILDSITRRVVLLLAGRLGVDVRQARFGLERLDAATEVMVWSTARKVMPVTAVGGRSFEPGPVTTRLHRAINDHVASQTGTTAS